MRMLLGLPGISFEIANIMTNKFVMKQILAAAGVPVTPFRLLLSLNDMPLSVQHANWPLVLKPIFGTGSFGTHIFHSPKEAQKFLDSSRSNLLRASMVPFIIEEAVDYLWEFHCDGIVRDGEVIFATASRYFGSLLGLTGKPNGSCTIPSESADFHAILSLHRATVAATGLRNGVTHMEGYRTVNGHLVGEIACRPGGGGITDLVRAQYGIDLWDAFMRSSLGEWVSAQPCQQPTLFARCRIPPKEGVVRGLATRAELEAIPWVESANILVDVGDELLKASHSTSHVATIVYRASNHDAALGRMHELDRLFRLDVA